MGKHTAGFTPGPWTLRASHPEVYAGEITSNTPGWIIGAKGKPMFMVCDCGGPADFGDISDGEARSNARLIAAAPDLLEACQTALRIIEPYNVEGDWEEIVEPLKQAIQKATEASNE